MLHMAQLQQDTGNREDLYPSSCFVNLSDSLNSCCVPFKKNLHSAGIFGASYSINVMLIINMYFIVSFVDLRESINGLRKINNDDQ